MVEKWLVKRQVTGHSSSLMRGMWPSHGVTNARDMSNDHDTRGPVIVIIV